MNWLAVAATAALTVTIATTSSAETRPAPTPNAEAIIYRDPNFQGPAVNVSSAQPRLGLVWTVGSIRLVSGHMQLCSQPNYKGTCVTATASYRDLSPLGMPGNRVQSMRPSAAPIPTPEPGGFGPSLRGMASEFFAQPSINGRRVRACRNGGSTMACANEGAAEFCRARGYNHVGNVAMETVAKKRVVLADVLCRRSPG